MGVKIAHARISEKGTIEGAAGDQSTHEVEISDWYSGGWLAVYRPNRREAAEVIAHTAEQCAENENIGYSQLDRYSLYKWAAAAGYKIIDIDKPCNTDCSAMVSVCVNAAGIPVPKDMTTRTEDLILMGTGEFTRLVSGIYLNNSAYLKRGDILRKSGHTAVVVSDGFGSETKVNNRTYIYADHRDKTLSGRYKPATDVYMREGGALSYRAMAVIKEGETIYCYGYYSVDNRGVKWLYAEFANNNIKYTGFVSSRYLQRAGDI